MHLVFVAKAEVFELFKGVLVQVGEIFIEQERQDIIHVDPAVHRAA